MLKTWFVLHSHFELQDLIQERNWSDNWGGGGVIHKFVLCPKDSFEINSNSKKIYPAEYKYMNKHPPPPPPPN